MARVDLRTCQDEENATVLVVLSALAALTLPPQGVFAPNRSLGGVQLGDTRASVVARWGTDFGTCRD